MSPCAPCPAELLARHSKPLVVLCSVSLRSSTFNKTSSHMWDTSYFPVFLLAPCSIGSITQQKIVKDQLSHVWDEVMTNTTDLKLKLHNTTRGLIQPGLHLCGIISLDRFGVGLLCQMVPLALASGVTYHTSNGVICGKYKYWSV